MPTAFVDTYPIPYSNMLCGALYLRIDMEATEKDFFDRLYFGTRAFVLIVNGTVYRECWVETIAYNYTINLCRALVTYERYESKDSSIISGAIFTGVESAIVESVVRDMIREYNGYPYNCASCLVNIKEKIQLYGYSCKISDSDVLTVDLRYSCGKMGCGALERIKINFFGKVVKEIDGYSLIL